ncbi:DNA repair protein XRCC2 [Exaiptasia diaphana]|uniref:RecA family profile 1 domain-containing protein n=1 Tax=Exaiptasia diaphana TaxID=2652724 RepID=A0A913XD85_EXADI|nr:DNA repair protein XRCC2 [Exaiptasia diaphana]KXJ29770.1 DNA repair protein XRCC2 [Exaiptasia diaphana]
MAAESAAQLFSRLGSRQPLNGLDSGMFCGIPNGIQPGDVVEFHGAEGCGKTEMLLHLIANCVLPQTWNDINLGGHGVQVIFIDTDFHFQVLRLVAILECRIENAKKMLTVVSHDADADGANDQNECTNDIEEFIKTCLSRLYVLRCNNSLELLTSLLSLEQMLMAKPEVCVLMIDSLSAYYWIDRSKGWESTNDQEENMKKIIMIIKKYAKDFLLVVIVTTHAIFSSSLKSVEPYFCRSWSSVVRYKYLFSRKDEHAFNASAVGPQPVFIAQRTLPRSNQFQKFCCTDKGVEFRS